MLNLLKELFGHLLALTFKMKTMKPEIMYDVAVIGGGIAGMATAMRLQAKGLSTIIFEAHGPPGGWRIWNCGNQGRLIPLIRQLW